MECCFFPLMLFVAICNLIEACTGNQTQYEDDED